MPCRRQFQNVNHRLTAGPAFTGDHQEHPDTYRYQPILIFRSVPSWIVSTNTIAWTASSQLIVRAAGAGVYPRTHQNRANVRIAKCAMHHGRASWIRATLSEFGCFGCVIGFVSARTRRLARASDEIDHELGMLVCELGALVCELAAMSAGVPPGCEAVEKRQDEQNDDQREDDQEEDDLENGSRSQQTITRNGSEQDRQGDHHRDAEIPPAILALEKLNVVGEKVRDVRPLIKPLPEPKEKRDQQDTSREPGRLRDFKVHEQKPQFQAVAFCAKARGQSSCVTRRTVYMTTLCAVLENS